MKFIPESDVYRLILGSKLETAQQFQDWLCMEVIPSIRTTGRYELHPQPQSISNEAIILLIQKVNENMQLSARTLSENLQVISRLTDMLDVEKKVIKELTPLAQIGSLAMGGTNCVSFADMAKLLTQKGYTIGQNRLIKLLRQLGYLFKQSTRPQQPYVEQGLFQLKESFYQAKDGQQKSSITTLITAKGQGYFLDLLLTKKTQFGTQMAQFPSGDSPQSQNAPSPVQELIDFDFPE